MNAFVIMTADYPHEVCFDEELALRRMAELTAETVPWGDRKYKHVHVREVNVTGPRPKTPPGAFGPEPLVYYNDEVSEHPDPTFFSERGILERLADEFTEKFERLGSTPFARLKVFLNIAERRNKMEEDEPIAPDTSEDWCEFINQHLRRAEAISDNEAVDTHGATYREHMVIIAALTVAAVEAFDRCRSVELSEVAMSVGGQNITSFADDAGVAEPPHDDGPRCGKPA